ncbi:MAG TPA: hypothetical protein DE313_05640 [Ruminococcus sp.]|nr:hypothetical protein [Ruminococcus sp.]
MRRMKKATSVLLSALLAFSMTAVATESASAIIDSNGCYGFNDELDMDNNDVIVQSTGDEPTVTVSNIIKFDAKKSTWDFETSKKFYCHVWKADGSATSSGIDWPEWQSEKERCYFDKEKGIVSYDLAKTGHNFDVSDGKIYYVIFSTDSGMESYTAVMSGTCIGDTLYCNGAQIENPYDSEKKSNVAVWESNPSCGPKKAITSTGNIVGVSFIDGESDKTLIADYLIKFYNDEAKTEKIQNILCKLKLSPQEVMPVVKERTDDKNIIKDIEYILSKCFDPADYSLLGDNTVEIIKYKGEDEELEIPRNIGNFQIKSIGDYAFSNSHTLKSVIIPKGFTNIGYYAFLGCENLKSITIPSSVNNIGKYALGYRTSKYTKDYIKIDGFTIKGVKGSVAEEYANELGFDFVAVEEDIFGDVDGNGVLSVADATSIQKYSADLIEFTDSQIEAADVNGDGAINVLDATAVQQILVGSAK